jgi:Flp pilus assembly protein TadB
MLGIENAQKASAQRRVLPWILVTLAVVLSFLLITEHRAHLFGFFPFLLIGACLVMHFFMHRGHGAHGHKADEGLPTNPDPEVRP